MEFIGKKRTNTNYLKSKSNEELINDQQNNTNKKVNNKKKKIIDKNIDKKYDINNSNNSKNFLNKSKFISFYNSNNENLLYFSYKLNPPKIFNSYINEYKFYCAYNCFINARPYNEDRILINCQQYYMNKIHLFAIFDGHGGDKCCKYLMNNFDKILFSQINLMNKTSKSLKETYLLLENTFKEINKPKNLLVSIEKSGSCALTILNIGTKIYCANAGDSRALYSENGSKEIYQISYEHKPQNEAKRIKKVGGTMSCSFMGNIWRLFPGGIAVRQIFINKILYFYFRYQDQLAI